MASVRWMVHCVVVASGRQLTSLGNGLATVDSSLFRNSALSARQNMENEGLSCTENGLTRFFSHFAPCWRDVLAGDGQVHPASRAHERQRTGRSRRQSTSRGSCAAYSWWSALGRATAEPALVAAVSGAVHGRGADDVVHVADQRRCSSVPWSRTSSSCYALSMGACATSLTRTSATSSLRPSLQTRATEEATGPRRRIRRQTTALGIHSSFSRSISSVHQ